jgi:hypothetical protein
VPQLPACGALTITKAISIRGHGFAGIAVPSGDGITIAASATDKVNLRGLSLDGVGTGTNGITFNVGASLNVQDCVIRAFASGIRFQPSVSSNLSVSNTLASDNSLVANIFDPSGSGIVTGALDHVDVEGNYLGLYVDGRSYLGTVQVTVSDSVIANNKNDGIDAISQAGNSATTVMVRNSTVASNKGTGLLVDGSPATLRFTRSTITGNNTGWQVNDNGTLSTYGDNDIDGNTTVNTTPPGNRLHK